jgi:hypothetical protein
VHTFHVPPSLRPHCSKLSAVGHPRAGTKLHPGKGIPNQADVSQTTGKTQSQVPTRTNSLQSSFPTCLSHPRKCAHSLLNSPSAAPLPFRASTTGQKEVSEPCSCSLAPSRNQFPKFSHLERISHGPDNPPLQYPMGLTTRFFSPSPKLTRYCFLNMYLKPTLSISFIFNNHEY